MSVFIMHTAARQHVWYKEVICLLGNVIPEGVLLPNGIRIAFTGDLKIVLGIAMKSKDSTRLPVMTGIRVPLVVFLLATCVIKDRRLRQSVGDLGISYNSYSQTKIDNMDLLDFKVCIVVKVRLCIIIQPGQGKFL